ncbi:MAG: transcription-repair coupling factor [Candidatus Riflebacteria bacterium]|nr:transcription-repair coupling factor [Candidatus Riflebacteria bacterium]
MLDDLLSLFSSTALVGQVNAALAAETGTVTVSGLVGSASRLLAASLAADRAVLLLLDDEDAVHTAGQDLAALLGVESSLAFPGPDVLEGEVLPLGWYELHHRFAVLDALAAKRPAVVLSTPLALLSPTMAPGLFRKVRRVVKLGETVDRDELVAHLDGLGYSRVPRVEAMGEFSVRGGILDLFGTLATRPIRIELFGDVVESLRWFDPTTQRSTGVLETVTLVPMREVLVRVPADLFSERKLDERSLALAQTLRGGKVPKGVERLLSFLPQQTALLTAHLPPGSVVVDTTSRLARDVARGQAEKTYGDDSWDKLEAELRQLPRANVGLGAGPSSGVFLEAGCQPLPEYLNETGRLVEDLRSFGEREFRRVVAASTRGGRDRLTEILSEAGLEVAPRAGTVQAVAVVQADLEQGFVLPLDRLAVVAENDLWQDRRVHEEEPAKRSRRASDADALRFSDFSEITEGSLVVHYEHGIGRFLGLKELRVDGVRQDYLEIEYQKGDKLFVPVNQLDRVQRFVGASEDGPARLARLGSAKWALAKHRVRKEVEELARKLLELYAKRETVQGFAFSPDNPWQRELEELFPFEETPDQLRCIDEVKEDMRKTRPMDRLVCGDVGYGKTEIAVRAAFKAVQDGRQVAVLAPTTILAEQHLHTFRTRMAAFPVNVGCLSRLRTPPQQKELLRNTASGRVDVLIGTHRILSRDVRFRELGLLIVDEEQRFGVSHKERIKELKESVDVLTMTATPIPRTLNLALSGARDISVLTTPPRGRLPIKTFVVEYSEELVKGAIERELARGGQVYYVYNRIESMDVAKSWLAKLVPKARVRVGHGQMERQELEDLMTDFYSGRFDVLLSTTIIESGLDVPNVNTIVLHRADCFGLSQLYQLRGRVGRTSRQAFAYLLYPSRTSLSGMAFERLKALEEHTDLGSGFKIAMRDLELRGAGNILGAEQHGFIDSVGFELYTRLLREAVAQLKGRPQEAPRELTKLELQVDCYIPSEYISDIDNRILRYRRLAEVASEEELQANILELQDCYGKPPAKLDALFRLMRVKMRATELEVGSLQQKENRVFFRLRQPEPPPAPAVQPKAAHPAVSGPRPKPAVPVAPALDPGRLTTQQAEWMQHVRRLSGPNFKPEDATCFSIFLGTRKNLEVLRLLEDVFQIQRPASELQMLPPAKPRSVELRSRRI